MQRKKLYILLGSAGLLLMIVSAIALALPQPAEAQCGSQASSCKNCHEIQGKDPVNTDGTRWHQSHAFGDFCYICHGGNSQAVDETAAHQGEVLDPMNDVQAACASCHPNDLEARVDMYAKVLNVPVNMGTAVPAPASTSGPAAAAPAPAATSAPAAAAPAAVAPVEPAAPATGSGQLVDYVQRYDQNVLGKYQVNWGNIILWALIAVMVLGGGGMILLREKLVRVTFQETKPVEGEYPGDVVDMVPNVAKLKPASRKTLGRLLNRPDAARLIDAVDTLTGGTEDKKE